MSNREFSKLQSLLYLYTIKHSVYSTPIEISSTGMKIKCPHCREIVEYNNYKIKGIFYKQKMYCRNCRKRFHAVNPFYKYYTKFTLFLVLKYKIDTAILKLKTKLINKLKSYSLIWRLYRKYRQITT